MSALDPEKLIRDSELRGASIARLCKAIRLANARRLTPSQITMLDVVDCDLERCRVRLERVADALGLHHEITPPPLEVGRT